MKGILTHFADAFSVIYTAVNGFLLTTGIKIIPAKIMFLFINVHDIFQGIVFYVGGIFTLLWLGFRAGKSYYDFLKSKNQT